MIDIVGHYIKIGMALQAETQGQKNLDIPSNVCYYTILYAPLVTISIRETISIIDPMKRGLKMSYSSSTHKSIRETESLNIRLSIGIISIIISIPRDGGLMQAT